ncbi:OmpA-like domain-containing protein [Synechococcus sp. MEDNS5]|uniref:OmpA family protein n=1 Tax=Synechococcus sp. MEDNS5 TaxID=1442554 RepID=UPI00164783AE|nr:hypothetical protein [Synechococcus sp. MEDNS5]QNJ06514.1 OmpA-like domain-containing protein [Synechococcus sp. MEDNS5]
MVKSNQSSEQQLRQWMGYTDILASSFLILMLVTVVSSLNNATNQKPPLIKLTEAQSFKFETGSYKLSQEFKNRLNRVTTNMVSDITKYRIDTIEVIGHTDGQPSPGISNLDIKLQNQFENGGELIDGLLTGSNVDLGLLRALSVAAFLREKLKHKEVVMPTILAYSASSLIDSNGKYQPADPSPQSQRRRIEIRFTRNQDLK